MPNRPFGTKWSAPELRSRRSGHITNSPPTSGPARSRVQVAAPTVRHRAGQRKIVHTAAAASATTTTTITTVTSSS
jgi:hypothetical protein